MLSRPSWDEYFIGIADAVSRRSACVRRQVGAVLVNADHRIVATGYNGSTPGGAECDAGGCPRGQQSAEAIPHLSAYTGAGACIYTHAEQNALNYLFTHRPQSMRMCVMYISTKPCNPCVDLMMGCGLINWVFAGPKNIDGIPGRGIYLGDARSDDPYMKHTVSG